MTQALTAAKICRVIGALTAKKEHVLIAEHRRKNNLIPLEYLEMDAKEIFCFLREAIPEETFKFLKEEFLKARFPKHKSEAFGFERSV